MDAKNVCEMIDTITEGKPYSLEVEGVGGSVCGGDDLRFSMTPDCVTVMSSDLITTCEITSPRQAREIAAALVAWANHKEGAIRRRTNADEMWTFPLKLINPEE